MTRECVEAEVDGLPEAYDRCPTSPVSAAGSEEEVDGAGGLGGVGGVPHCTLALHGQHAYRNTLRKTVCLSSARML